MRIGIDPTGNRPRPGQPSGRFPTIPNDPIPDDADAVLRMLNSLPKITAVDMSTNWTAGKEYNSQIARRMEQLRQKAASLGMDVYAPSGKPFQMRPMSDAQRKSWESSPEGQKFLAQQNSSKPAPTTPQTPSTPPNPNQAFLPTDSSQPNTPSTPAPPPSRPGSGTDFTGSAKPPTTPQTPPPESLPQNPMNRPVIQRPVIQRPGGQPDYSNIPYRDRPLDAIPKEFRNFYQQQGGVRESISHPSRPSVSPLPSGSIMPDGRYMLDDGKTQRVFARDPKTGAIDFASGGETRLVYAKPSALPAAKRPASTAGSPAKPSASQTASMDDLQARANKGDRRAQMELRKLQPADNFTGKSPYARTTPDEAWALEKAAASGDQRAKAEISIRLQTKDETGNHTLSMSRPALDRLHGKTDSPAIREAAELAKSGPNQLNKPTGSVNIAGNNKAKPNPLPAAGSAIPGKPGAVADGKGGFSYPSRPSPLEKISAINKAKPIPKIGTPVDQKGRPLPRGATYGEFNGLLTSDFGGQAGGGQSLVAAPQIQSTPPMPAGSSQSGQSDGKLIGYLKRKKQGLEK